MLSTNDLKTGPLPKDIEEKKIKDGKGGFLTVLVRKTKDTIITTRDITVAAFKGEGKPQKNYYPPLTTNAVPFPESNAARKKRMDAIERELDKKRLADGVEPVLKSRGKVKKK